MSSHRATGNKPARREPQVLEETKSGKGMLWFERDRKGNPNEQVAGLRNSLERRLDIHLEQFRWWAGVQMLPEGITHPQLHSNTWMTDTRTLFLELQVMMVVCVWEWGHRKRKNDGKTNFASLRLPSRSGFQQGLSWMPSGPPNDRGCSRRRRKGEGERKVQRRHGKRS